MGTAVHVGRHGPFVLAIARRYPLATYGFFSLLGGSFPVQPDLLSGIAIGALCALGSSAWNANRTKGSKHFP